MKSKGFTAAVILVVMIVVLCLGCVSIANGMPESLRDYFPLKPNVRYIYEGYGSEYASYSVYNDYISNNRAQQRINNGGTEIARGIEADEQSISVVFSREEAYYRENLLDKTADNRQILIKTPLKAGTTWSLGDSKVRTITDTAAIVDTPSGSYKAIEVVTQAPDYKTVDYYAKNIGLVKSEFISGDTKVASSLSSIEENVPLIQTVRFYYPNAQDAAIKHEDKNVNFFTNDITRKVLEQAYKDLDVGVFSPNTKINWLYLNEDGMVYIDLSNAFITEMNAGALYEQAILQSVANTFGNYYNAQRVILTIDNNLYESGHIKLKKGEYLEVRD